MIILPINGAKYRGWDTNLYLKSPLSFLFKMICIDFESQQSQILLTLKILTTLYILTTFLTLDKDLKPGVRAAHEIRTNKVVLDCNRVGLGLKEKLGLLKAAVLLWLQTVRNHDIVVCLGVATFNERKCQWKCPQWAIWTSGPEPCKT